jgi:hypothetical protein
MKLLNVDTNAKTVKGQKKGYLTGILYLAPHKESGVANVCPNATPGCIKSCLFTAGRGEMKTVQSARVKKTILFKTNQSEFLKLLIHDIELLIKQAQRKELIPVVRLNGTSDIPFENLNIFDKFPDIQFYDYTKSEKRMIEFLVGNMPKNYHLTFSKSELNDNEVNNVLKMGGNVAIVFNKVPTEYQGYKVVDADVDDLRFLDGENVICGLKSKGRGRKDKSGFVIYL